MAKVWGRPEVPPPVEKLGEVVTRFDGWVVKNASSPKGHHEFTVAVTASEKFKALLMAEHQGTMLHFEIHLRVKSVIPEFDPDDPHAMERILGIEDGDEAIRAALNLGDL